MPRFFVPPEQIRGGRFTLLGSEARHAVLVLRKKKGDDIDLFDGKDLSYRGRIESVSPDRVDGVLTQEEKRLPSSGPSLVLYQSLIKGPKWDWLVEKACEIGVSRLIPIAAMRSTVRLTPEGEKAKIERWCRMALAASKQCGRQDVMQVDASTTMESALTNLGPDSLSLIPWEKELERSVRQGCGGKIVKRVNIFIGPEGGWESSEVKRAVQAGVIPVRLGIRLLRSETAGLVASTLVLGELGDLA